MPKKRRALILQCRLPPELFSRRISHSLAHLPDHDLLLTALFDEFCNQTRPTGLVVCTDPGSIVSVKVFIEKDEVAPVGIVLKELRAAHHRPAAIRIAEKNANESPGYFRCDLPEIGFRAGMRGTFNFEVLAVVMVIFLERFHQQIVNRKPDGPAPVRIPAKKARGGFGRLVLDAADISVHLNFVRMILVVARKGAHTIRRKKFRFVQHAAEHALELFAVHEREETAHTASGTL